MESDNKDIVDQLEILIKTTKDSNKVIEEFTMAVFVLVLFQISITVAQVGFDTQDHPYPMFSLILLFSFLFVAGSLCLKLLKHFLK